MPDIGLGGLLLDSPHSGSATYARNLARRLPAAAPDFRFRLFVRDAVPAVTAMPVDRLLSPFDHIKGRGAGWARLDKLAWETLMLPLAAESRGQDLIHSLYFAAPAASGVPVVVTVHDVIPLVLPGYYRGRAARVYSALMAWAVRRARAIVTVSDHAREDIVRVLGVPEESVFVTPEAADERFVPVGEPGERERIAAAYRLPSRFLLYLGGAERRKNLEVLLSAWEAVQSQMAEQGVHLVIVARFPPPDALYPDIPGLVRERGLRNVCLVPSVSEEDKPAVYRAALAFCFPSLYEGFGLTPLEAMACGVPVIASNATSIPEVVGDAGLLLPPTAPDEWAETMLQVAGSTILSAALAQRGLQRARQFSWERTAQLTVAVYRTVLQS